MGIFRFAIMGAGAIAGRFCHAVSEMDNCVVTAVASKSKERADDFARKNGVPSAYASYSEMLEKEKPDCVYIATTPDSHYSLTMLCMKAGVPVLCEKAMFANSRDAEDAFSYSEKNGIFCMEALWSRFLPANRKALEWINEGRIGRLSYMDIKVGFRAPQNNEVRYLNPALCGGASTDITCYAYELARFYADSTAGKPVKSSVIAKKAESGVDLSDHVVLVYPDMIATLYTSFDTALEENATIYGTEGKIVIPYPHFASEAFLYNDGKVTEHFRDGNKFDSFRYEIEDAMSNIRAGNTQSKTVPHELTLDCARIFDAVAEEIKKEY